MLDAAHKVVEVAGPSGGGDAGELVVEIRVVVPGNDHRALAAAQEDNLLEGSEQRLVAVDEVVQLELADEIHALHVLTVSTRVVEDIISRSVVAEGHLEARTGALVRRVRAPILGGVDLSRAQERPRALQAHALRHRHAVKRHDDVPDAREHLHIRHGIPSDAACAVHQDDQAICAAGHLGEHIIFLLRVRYSEEVHASGAVGLPVFELGRPSPRDVQAFAQLRGAGLRDGHQGVLRCVGELLDLRGDGRHCDSHVLRGQIHFVLCCVSRVEAHLVLLSPHGCRTRSKNNE
mmetsp:Transcript_61340/g.161193  ORF Transcript_61340/g.161193 Transcript_61340/m.161193 type:complete len:291 (+) Transcript_61340:526-1398(+)